jgi:ABC-2 type transport system ATP-binding protein
MVVARGPGAANNAGRGATRDGGPGTVDGAGRIVVSGLTKRFGPVTAVEDLSFTVEPGSITGFLGPNGAGKTTTLRMLLGLVTPDAGSATIGGRPYQDLPRPYDQVGAALEATGFHPARTGRNHLWVYCTVNGYPHRRADEVLDVVGLSGAGRRAVGGYSLGMRQRLALAAALLGDPAVLVLDEPANGLDPEGIAWLRRLLRDLAAEGRTVLVSSHLLAEAQQFVDRVVIIHRGRCVRQGSLADLAAEQGPVVRVRTSGADRLSAALARAAVRPERITRTGPDELRVAGVEAEQVGRLAFGEGVEVLWLAAEAGDLEQVFFALTTGGEQSGGDQPAGVLRQVG